VPARFGQRLLWRLCVRCGPWSVGLGRAGDGEADDPRDAAPQKPHRGAPAEAHGPSVFSRNWPAMPELTGAALALLGALARWAAGSLTIGTGGLTFWLTGGSTGRRSTCAGWRSRSTGLPSVLDASGDRALAIAE